MLPQQIQKNKNKAWMLTSNEPVGSVAFEKGTCV